MTTTELLHRAFRRCPGVKDNRVRIDHLVGEALELGMAFPNILTRIRAEDCFDLVWLDKRQRWDGDSDITVEKDGKAHHYVRMRKGK